MIFLEKKARFDAKLVVICGFWLIFGLSLQQCAFTGGAVTDDQLRKMTPAQALARLEEGNKRFAGNRNTRHNLNNQRFYTGRNGQNPPVAVLGSVDARTAPELIFNQGIGDLLCVRAPASIVTSENVGALEFACRRLNTKVVVLLLQRKDAFIEAAVENDMTGNQAAITLQIKPAFDAIQRDRNWRRFRREELVELVSREHLTQNMARLRAMSPILRGMAERGEIIIVGAIYDVETGKVAFLKSEE